MESGQWHSSQSEQSSSSRRFSGNAEKTCGTYKSNSFVTHKNNISGNKTFAFKDPQIISLPATELRKDAKKLNSEKLFNDELKLSKHENLGEQNGK